MTNTKFWEAWKAAMDAGFELCLVFWDPNYWLREAEDLADRMTNGGPKPESKPVPKPENRNLVVVGGSAPSERRITHD